MKTNEWIMKFLMIFFIGAGAMFSAGLFLPMSVFTVLAIGLPALLLVLIVTLYCIEI
jgi:hypothetical protein